jgi:hypothetical protein
MVAGDSFLLAFDVVINLVEQIQIDLACFVLDKDLHFLFILNRLCIRYEKYVAFSR